jgi:plasmid stabilization system protein ParE
MKIHYTDNALLELEEIMRWNAKFYDLEHAENYIQFLRQSIQQLAETPERGQQVDRRPELRYALLRNKHRGKTHIVVYTHTSDEFYVQHLFHSSQNWQELIERGEGI